MGDLIKGNILLLSNSALSALTSLGAFLYIWLNLKTKPMKRILLAALMIGTHFATAQEEIDTYEMSRFEKEPYVKYRNPSASRDVIPNEHLINWNVPVILCEGLFDAIAIKRNAIPLLGKNIQSSLMKKIVTSVVDKIYIALDRDAIKQALKFCERLMAEGKEVYLVDLQDKDPSEMGFENFTKLIQTTLPLTYYDLMEQKLAI